MGFAVPIVEYARCPMCGHDLKPVERVETVTTSARVPDYLPERELWKYQQRRDWVLVECDRGHRLKQVGDSLYGEDAY